jgi:hypothetical protein
VRFSLGKATYEASFIYLDSLRQIEPAFAQLRTQLFLFNEKYVILPNYIDDARKKLGEYRTKFLQDAYRLLNRKYEDRDIELASEIYVTGNTYTKVWPIIVQFTEDKEQTLIDNIRRQQASKSRSLSDANPNRSYDALNELRKLNDLKSAYEKAICIRSTLDLTLAQKTLRILDQKNSTVTYHSSSDSMIMAADETLTAFIELICQLVSSLTSIESVQLVAHEYYAETFRFLSLPQDVAYAFTTYRAALEHLTDYGSFTDK